MRLSRLETYDDLKVMCSLIESGATIMDISMKQGVSLGTTRARRELLAGKIGVLFSVTMRKGRGFGTPVYYLAEPIQSAIAKIDEYETKGQETRKRVNLENAAARKEKGRGERNEVISSGLRDGFDMGSWFFITDDRAKEFYRWCYPWDIDQKDNPRAPYVEN